jgi:hypothetical protein
VSCGSAIGSKVGVIFPVLPNHPIHLILLTHSPEAGTICSLVYDIPNKKISTLLAFSQGHWEYPQEAHGDKRNPADLERWRGLAKIGKQTDRFMLNEQADILEAFTGKGDLVPIDPEAETL